jgi:hypothetical protein
MLEWEIRVLLSEEPFKVIVLGDDMTSAMHQGGTLRAADWNELERGEAGNLHDGDDGMNQDNDWGKEEDVRY